MANKGLFCLNLCTYASYTFLVIPMLTVATNKFFNFKIYKYLEKIDVPSNCFRCASKFRIESNQSKHRYVS